MSAPLPLNIGMEPFPGYRLCGLRGRGGFATVWEATKSNGSPVALKFLPAGDGSSAAREIRSIQTVRQLEHPYLVQLEQIWCIPGYIVVGMELAEGSLLDLLNASQAEFGAPLPADQVCSLLASAADALDFLNARQHMVGGKRVAIQHCDVKPSNLLLFGDTVKLADFGLASPTTTRFQPHRRAGTLDYLAPEVFKGRLSEHSDQYALAASYCQLRGGRLPFNDTPAEFCSTYNRPAPDLSMLSAPERPIIGRALHTVPQDRWPSCREMLAQLANVVT
ncbi:MAG TPA: serine/threonine-protein kinase [Gemmataceae bacterium]|nr:serine/threonine-protein kinase [Gemmataceae bacterium]